MSQVMQQCRGDQRGRCTGCFSLRSSLQRVLELGDAFAFVRASTLAGEESADIRQAHGPPTLAAVTRAAGEGSHVVGIDGNCESPHEADATALLSAQQANETEVT